MSGQASIAVINPKNYQFLQEHVYSHAGIVLEGDKHYLFESRLAPIVSNRPGVHRRLVRTDPVLLSAGGEPPGCRSHD